MKLKRHAVTVLLVDDSPIDRHLMTSLLGCEESMLYTLLESESAADGLQVLGQAHIDCIVLDFHLPDMNGLEFLESMFSQRRGQHPPVLMVTGEGSEKLAVETFRAGAINYVNKDTMTARGLHKSMQEALRGATKNRNVAQKHKEREHVSQENKKNADQYRMLVDSISAYAIVLLDTDGRLVTWNRGARDMFGFHDHEIVGQHIRQLYDDVSQDLQQPEEDLAKARRGPLTFTRRKLVRKDGCALVCASAINPVYDLSGSLCGYSLVARDLTWDDVAQNEGQAQKGLHSGSEVASWAALDNRLDQLCKAIRKDTNQPQDALQMSCKEWGRVIHGLRADLKHLTNQAHDPAALCDTTTRKLTSRSVLSQKP